MRIKNSHGLHGRWILWENRHTLIKQKWRQNSWTILESLERQKQSLCCCVQCSQSSAFLWLLYHLIKTVESLLSATCLFLVHFECHCRFLVLFALLCKFLSSSHDHYNLRPDVFRWDYTNSFQTNLLVSWLGKHTLPTTSVSARKCEIHQILP